MNKTFIIYVRFSLLSEIAHYYSINEIKTNKIYFLFTLLSIFLIYLFPSQTENLPDSTEKSPIIGHTHEVGLISSEDMGDFLSHVANEEEAVDPDLDLDFDSIPHESSSLSSSGMRSYVESPVEQADTSLNLNDDIELISRNLRSSSGKMNTVIDDNDDDDSSLSPSLNSLTTDNTINNNNNIQLSYPSPILEEKEEEEAEVEEVYTDNNDLDDNHHCEVEVPRMTKSL